MFGLVKKSFAEYWKGEAVAARAEREAYRAEAGRQRERLAAVEKAYQITEERSVALVEALANQELEEIFENVDSLQALHVNVDQIFGALDRYLYGDGVREVIRFIQVNG